MTGRSLSLLPGNSQPMENFPPGIKTMPGGLADSAKSCET
jgi:hypothetical protein